MAWGHAAPPRLAGLPRVRFYDLRHTAAMRMLLERIPQGGERGVRPRHDCYHAQISPATSCLNRLGALLTQTEPRDNQIVQVHRSASSKLFELHRLESLGIAHSMDLNITQNNPTHQVTLRMPKNATRAMRSPDQS